MNYHNYAFFIIAAILISLSNTLFAQKDFTEGYIIANDNDTVYGLVNQKSALKQSNYCEFKENGNAEIETYYPFDIIGYGILDKKFYVAKRVPIEEDTVDLFLEYLVNGVVDLYYLKLKGHTKNTVNNSQYHTEQSEEEIYFIEKDSILLKMTNELRNEPNSARYFRTNQYKGALNYAFSDCPELKNSINSTQFYSKSLIKITEDYHNYMCSDYACINYRKNTNIVFEFEPYLGYAYTIMDLKNSNYSHTNSMGAGGYIHFSSLSTYEKLRFTTGVFVSKLSIEDDFYNSSYYEDGHYIFDLSYGYIKIPLNFRYYFSSKKLSPFIQTGIFGVFTYNFDYHLKRQISDFLDRDLTDELSIDKYQYGLEAMTGVKYAINKKSYLLAGINIEYRMIPPVEGVRFFHHTYYTTIFSFGYGIALN